MLKVVVEQRAIKKYAGLFNKRFKPFVDEELKVKLGHQGASFPAKVFWSQKLGVWKFSQIVKETRYWNAFGLEKPVESGVLSIASEINFPWDQIDRKTGGAFAEDHCGNGFVIHRGKIGGGKKGVGKSLFEQHYRGVWAFMEDGDCVSQVAVIGHLQSSRFALQAAQFVRKIEMMKLSAAASAQTEMDFAEVRFRENLIGGMAPLPEEQIADACDRDVLVRQLADELQRRKIKIGNDAKTELLAVDAAGKRLSHIFEVIADTAEKNVAAAVGKVMLQISGSERPILPVLALPENIASRYEPDLQRLNISVIRFHWKGETAVFSGLEKIRMDESP